MIIASRSVVYKQSNYPEDGRPKLSQDLCEHSCIDLAMNGFTFNKNISRSDSSF